MILKKLIPTCFRLLKNISEDFLIVYSSSLRAMSENNYLNRRSIYEVEKEKEEEDFLEDLQDRVEAWMVREKERKLWDKVNSCHDTDWHEDDPNYDSIEHDYPEEKLHFSPFRVDSFVTNLTSRDVSGIARTARAVLSVHNRKRKRESSSEIEQNSCQRDFSKSR